MFLWFYLTVQQILETREGFIWIIKGTKYFRQRYEGERPSAKGEAVLSLSSRPTE
jgi:hypothetical protein